MLATFLITLFIWFIIGLPLELRKARKENKKNREASQERYERLKQSRMLRKKHLSQEFEKHKTHLVLNFNRTIIPNEYGAIGAKSIQRWRDEIIRFLESVDLPKHLFKKDKDIEEAIEYVNQLTQNHVKEPENDNVGLVNFEGITDPNVYEIACAKELEIHGWQAQASPVGADQGIDVRASKEGLNVVIQCKLYSNPVGNKAVQEALSGKVFDKADFAAVVAPNGYTRSALELAQSTGVLLLSHNDLKNLFGLISSHLRPS